MMESNTVIMDIHLDILGGAAVGGSCGLTCLWLIKLANNRSLFFIWPDVLPTSHKWYQTMVFLLDYVSSNLALQ